MTLSIGISESNRDSIVKILNAVLADEYVLYTKTRNYHWNVVGPQFNDLHKFFEGQYEALNEVVDDVAERARSWAARPSAPWSSSRSTRGSRSSRAAARPR